MIYRDSRIKHVNPTDCFFKCSKAKLRQIFTNLGSNKLEEVHNEFRLASKFFAQLGVLSRDTYGTRI